MPVSPQATATAHKQLSSVFSKLRMSTNTATNLPPYSEKQPAAEMSTHSAPATANRITGSIQTCSIRDYQVDYLTIVPVSATSYHICLTVDPTPLYRIELLSDSKVGDIQIFPASNTSLPPVAAARLSANAKSKTEPAATICTSSPHLPDAAWRPVQTSTGMLSVESYKTAIPIITVPGRSPTPHEFSWRTGSLAEPFYQLWWEGPLPLFPEARFFRDQRGSEYIFATVSRKTAAGGENLIEIRRGGGLDFELSVVLELFVVLHFKKQKLL
jgi:hypothetical protein